jgi:hypothetical protein
VEQLFKPVGQWREALLPAGRAGVEPEDVGRALVLGERQEALTLGVGKAAQERGDLGVTVRVQGRVGSLPAL